MKATKILSVIIGVWLVLGFGPSFSLAGEGKEAAPAASPQQKEEYQKKMETKLKELNQELKEWKDKAGTRKSEPGSIVPASLPGAASPSSRFSCLS